MNDAVTGALGSPMLIHSATGAAQLAPSAQTATLVHADTVSMANPAMLHWINPGVLPIFYVRPQPRANFHLPTLVSPGPNPDDSLLYEDPQDGTHKFFLTAYALATTTVNGAQAKWVGFTPTGTGFTLTVHLADVTPAATVAGNGRLTPDTRYLIAATVQSRQVSWDLVVDTTVTDGGLALTLAIPDLPTRDLIYAAMTDPAAGASLIIRRTLDLALPAATAGQYTPATRAIDTSIGFTFDKTLDAAVFAGLSGMAAPPATAWNIVTVDWGQRQHTYYQSTTQTDQVFFLPDSFKIGRQANPPRPPNLAVTAQGASADAMVMTLNYLAVPVWSQERIADAANQLQKTLGLAKAPTMALFEASAVSLFLSLPSNDAAAGASLAQQTNALIDLAAGVQGSVTMGLAPFRQLYQALFDPAGTLMSGEVRVSVQNNIAALPFIARMSDLAGDIFSQTSSFDSKSDALDVVLTNIIESPIHIDTVTGTVLRAGQPLSGTAVNGTTPQLPIDLAPGDALTVTLGASTSGAIGGVIGAIGSFLGGGNSNPLGGVLGAAANVVIDPTCTARLDLGGAKVNPDAKALWAAIMANSAPSPISRTVALKFLASGLQPASAGANAVVAAQVVFQGGQTASFDASMTADGGGFIDQTLTLSAPLEAFVLQDAPTDSYTYRIDKITPSGVQQGDWTTDNRDTLYVILS